MAAEKNRAEALRWLRAADDDLKTADVLKKAGQFAHCCFHSQQAAEKALKAVLYDRDADPWGHSVAKLLGSMRDITGTAVDQTRHAHALVLDRFYVPTRYPNGLPELSPDEAYGATDAETALLYGREIVGWAKTMMETR